MSISVRPNRPNDYIYDPNYIVSGPKDFYKQAISAKMATAKFAICPIFPSMFSDLRNYPRKQYIMRKSRTIPQYIDKIHDTKSMKSTVSGADRYKHFHNPVTTTTPVPKLDFKCFYAVDEEEKKKIASAKLIGKCKNVKVQTIYRETSAQTSPWEPDYKVIRGDPELLKLHFLKWGAGLPPSVHEIVLIERARMKAKWAKNMPAVTDAKTLKAQTDMIQEMERNEWAFREQEIQDIQDLRLELLERMLEELHDKSKCRTEKKMRMYCDMKLKERNEKLTNVRNYNNREKRRLEFNYKGILTKYGHVNVFKEHADYKSELYVPLIRHGSNPKYGHELLSKAYKKYKSQYSGVELFDTKPTWLNKSTNQVKDIKLPGTRLCIRETKWTSAVLKQLHEELKYLGQIDKKFVNLRVRIEEKEERIQTPEIQQTTTDKDEEEYQNSVFLQKVLRGRAAQFTIFQGRDRCRELIDELRCNIAILKSKKEKAAAKKEKTKAEQYDAYRCKYKIKMLEMSLKKLGGLVVGTLLDFLNKELIRLHQERQAHAMAMLLERERLSREACEAGRRQKELRRRLEHDEMFKQCMKIHQESVDLYLQDIITEGIEFASDVEAKRYVDKLAAQVDESTEEIKMKDVLEKEEYIANLVHHFVIPEVEKNIVRQRMRNYRKTYLLAAHEEIYGNIDGLPKATSKDLRTDSSYLSSESTIAPPRLLVRKEVIKDDALHDVRSLLNELINIPIQEHALKVMKPCYKELDIEEIFVQGKEEEEKYDGGEEDDDDDSDI